MFEVDVQNLFRLTHCLAFWDILKILYKCIIKSKDRTQSYSKTLQLEISRTIFLLNETDDKRRLRDKNV